MLLVITVFLSLVPIFDTCVPTQIITTTTIPCCPILSQSSLPKRNPVSTTFQQCSILRRLSSSCPVDGFVFCDAAPDTNENRTHPYKRSCYPYYPPDCPINITYDTVKPTMMQIEFFNLAGNVVRTVTNTGNTLAVTVFCRNATWTVLVGNTFEPIATVSCAQTGSAGADRGYVLGSAVS